MLACGSFVSAENPHNAKTQQAFKTMVVVGDSLSAGFQNFSLFDSSSVPGLPSGGQKQGYTAIVANQAGAALPQALISYPGIPPALTLNSMGQLSRGTTTGSRENNNQQAYNLSVPGFTVADALAHPFVFPPTNAIDAMADSVLATPGVTPGCGVIPTTSGLILSEVVCASALQPSIIFVSIGNNDALQSVTLGIPPTDLPTFAGQFATLIGTLSRTGAKLVVANVPDVSVVPFLIPVPAFQAACGLTISPPLPGSVTSLDYVVLDITNPNPTAVNVCTNYAVRTKALVDSAQGAVVGYNVIIEALTLLYRGVVVDVNGLLVQIAQKGYNAGGHKLTTAFGGGIFSLDGIHPTNTGYAILANEFIKEINRGFGTDVPPVSVEHVAATDPLVPPKH